MIISYCNIRGHNDPIKHGFVHGHVLSKKLDIMAFLETRIRHGKELAVIRKWNNWSFENNMDMARNGII